MRTGPEPPVRLGHSQSAQPVPDFSARLWLLRRRNWQFPVPSCFWIDSTIAPWVYLHSFGCQLANPHCLVSANFAHFLAPFFCPAGVFPQRLSPFCFVSATLLPPLFADIVALPWATDGATRNYFAAGHYPHQTNCRPTKHRWLGGQRKSHPRTASILLGIVKLF